MSRNCRDDIDNIDIDEEDDKDDEGGCDVFTFDPTPIQHAINKELGLRLLRSDGMGYETTRGNAAKIELEKMLIRISIVSLVTAWCDMLDTDDPELVETFRQATLEDLANRVEDSSNELMFCDFCEQTLTDLDPPCNYPCACCGSLNDVCRFCAVAHVDSEAGTVRKCSPSLDLSPCSKPVDPYTMPEDSEDAENAEDYS